MKLFQIIKKDLKILIRSRLSALIVLLGPLLIVLLVGMAFNSSSVNNIKIYTYSGSYSELSNSLVDALIDQQFSVNKVNSENECIDSIKTGTSHICIVMPPDLSVKENTTNEITFYVDNSRVNFVYLVINEVNKKVSLQSKELGKTLAQELINVINNAEVKLIDTKDRIATLRSSNQKIGTDVSSIIGNIGNFAIDLNVTELRVTDLDSGNLSCSNCSSEYSSAISNIVNKLQGLQNQATQINAAKAEIQKSVDSIKSESDKSAENLDTLSESTNNMLAGINSLSVKQAENIVTPIKTSVKPISATNSNLNFLFPTLVALVIMFVSILLSATMVMREKKSRAYFRNFITPTNNFTFILGALITCLLILIIQLVIIFGQSLFIQNSLVSLAIFGSLFLMLLIIAILFILIGMFIGYIFNSEETVILASMSIAVLLIFLSNTILPIETIPLQLKWLAFLNPFVVADSILKKMLLFNSGISSVLAEIYLLVAYICLFLALVYLARIINKRKLV